MRGGATAGDDYTAQAQRKTVEIDQTSTTISVDTLPDELDEPDEKFTVELRLVGDPPDVVLGQSRATGTIQDGTTSLMMCSRRK